MEAKQSRVLEKLQAREDARKAQREQKQEEGLTARGTSNESAATFLQQFSAEARSIQQEIEAVYYEETGNSTPGSTESSTRFQILNDKLGRLEDSVSLASYYLLQYDVRQCLERIKNLKELFQTAKEARQPRKKFSFSGKAITSMENSSKTQNTDINSSHQAKLHQPEAALFQPKGRVISKLRATDLVIQPGDELTEMDDVTISNLQECRVHILGPIGALYVHQIKNCVIVTGPVVGASYIEGDVIFLLLLLIVSTFAPSYEFSQLPLYATFRCSRLQILHSHTTSSNSWKL